MTQFVIFNWKEGKVLDYDFNPVESINDAWIYESKIEGIEEIESRMEPFCRVIKIDELESAMKKTEEYNSLGGFDFLLLKNGQKFKVLQKGWEGKTFVYQPQEFQPKGDYIYLYEFENHKGSKVRISGNMASVLKVEVI